MALSNRQRIEQGLAELKTALQPYVENELTEAAKGPRQGDVKQALNELDLRVTNGKINWDIQALLKAMIKMWGTLFRYNFPKHESSRIRSLIGEANDIRNRHAHEMPFSYDDAYRDLDTLSRVADAIDSKEVGGKLRDMAKAVMRVQFQEDARVDVRKAPKPMAGTPLIALKPWREVIAPHSDVAKGKFLESEFVADLHAVHTGQATTEYGQPVDFFARTFLTEGLHDLLNRSLERLARGSGSPVIELKTNFGGGKTHSLLALYHLFSEVQSTELPGLDGLLKESKIDNAPDARRVVIAGHQLGVNQPRKKSAQVTVNTLWGEMAWQLGGENAYEKVRSSDESGTNPGAEVLARLMNDAGPCLILIDEWVAYLRETVDKNDLAAGNFESNFGFAQSLTEAAKVVPNALVVASLPASKIEMGGSAGEAAFDRLSNLFQRVATPWQPTKAEEGYEIVRRRLFESQIDYPARDAVVKAYYELYKKGGNSFPSHCSEQEYRRKLEACYPIHPELFDKLDAVWSTLEKFQKTRGVLRLMAAVISELWQRDDRNLAIMPASVPLDSAKVANVINEVLPGGGSWNSVINSDIDGQAAVAPTIDSDNQSLGKYSACRRVARTIFMGAAPTQGPNRGLDDQHLLLGCVQPGENGDKFGDALRRLSDKATYLYRDSSRSWFALTPSISRLAQDRTRDFLEQEAEIDERILERLRKWQGRNVFAGGVSLAQSSTDLPDEMETRLVLLPPAFSVPQGAEGNNEATEKAEEFLTQSGKKSRTFRNALVFLAADARQLGKLRESVATSQAWESIHRDAESLELTNHDKSQVESKKTEWRNTVSSRLGDSWNRILVPRVKDPKNSKIHWEIIPCNDSESDSKVRSVFKKLKQKEHIYEQLSPFHLKRELERHLWGQRDHISTREVEKAFASFLFFPRLTRGELLIDSISSAFSGQALICEFFGYAEAYDEDKGKYEGLCATSPPFSPVIGDSLLVKPDVAMANIPVASVISGTSIPSGSSAGGSKESATQTGSDESEDETCGGTSLETKLTRYYGSIDLDSDKVASSVQKVVDEVIQHLGAVYGTDLKITLDITAENPEGFDESTVRTVSENANTLGFKKDSNGFEEA